jgi:hypothetical protein
MERGVFSTATLAAMLLITNIAGSQIANGLTSHQKQLLQSWYVRWIAIFAVFYVAFNNIIQAGLFSFGAIIILEFLLNENSRYYLFRRNENGLLKTVGSDALESMEAFQSGG